MPAETSRTSVEGSGTWASSATLTRTCPRPGAAPRPVAAVAGPAPRTGRPGAGPAARGPRPPRRSRARAAGTAPPPMPHRGSRSSGRRGRARRASDRRGGARPAWSAGSSSSLPAFGQPGCERLLERLPGHVRSVLARQAVAGEVPVLLFRGRREPSRRPRRGAGSARSRSSTSSASQASSPVGAPRPSHSFSSRLRWRSVRSYAVIADSLSGHSERIASSMKSRRFDGIPDHDDEVVGPEVHRAHLPPQIALAPHRRTVHLHAVRAAARDLDLDQHLAGLVGDHLAARVGGPVRIAPDHGFGGRGPRRLEEEQEGDALEQVGLALAVGTRDRDQARRGARRAASRRGCGSPGVRPTPAATRHQPTGVGSRTGITRYVNSSDSPRTIPGFRPSRTSSRTDSPEAAARPSAR